MKVTYKKSRKMPTLNSYYLSDFGAQTLQKLKDSKPFATYWKDLQEYECTEEVYSAVKPLEPHIEEVSKISQFVGSFTRKSKEKYGYQDDAVDFAMTTNDVFLNFPQGMGKSFTTMKILKARRIQRTLIICGQSNLQEEWLKDIVKHDMQSTLNAGIIGADTGAPTAKKLSWLDEAKEQQTFTHLLNIEALRNVDIVAKLNEMDYQAIVIDEVQSAKGWKAEQTQGVHELIRTPNQLRMALSGTAVLNTPLEFFSFLKYFGLLQDTVRSTFEKYYGEWGFDYWGHYVCKGYRNLDKLAELIKPVLCYAEKSELNLPPKLRVRIPIHWTAPEKFTTLQLLYKKPIKTIKKFGYNSKTAIRAQMQFLSSTAVEKYEFILNTFKPGEKVLVFSEYTTVLDNLIEYLQQHGRKTALYTGKLSMKERLEELQEWHDGKIDILLLSVGSARYGLNLTEANATVLLEPPDSLAILEQVEDRAHRIGQTKPVKSYLLATPELDDPALDSMVEKQQSLEKLYEQLKSRTIL